MTRTRDEVYRAVGCIIGFRGPDGVEYIFQNKAILDEVYNRMMIELTEVDSLENDDSVVINLYRGMDRLLTDATGQKVMAGGTQRIDYRWGESLIRQFAGQIVDGVDRPDGSGERDREQRDRHQQFRQRDTGRCRVTAPFSDRR